LLIFYALFHTILLLGYEVYGLKAERENEYVSQIAFTGNNIAFGIFADNRYAGDEYDGPKEFAA
jgi:hypothetical protein